MPANNDKYKQHPLVLEAVALRELHLKLKDSIYDTSVRQQAKIPTKKELITSSTVFTKAKEHVIRLAKQFDKKEEKASGKGTTSKLRTVRIDDTMAEYLELKNRGFKQVRLSDGTNVWAYPDTLVTSRFTDWAVSNNLQNGKEIKLTGTAGEKFKKLFMDDLKAPGSGPTIKNLDGTETKTSVLDEAGNQINPFHMNKHMFVFARHYPHTAKNVGSKYTLGRHVISRDEHPDLYVTMEKEHALLTEQLKAARQKYKDAFEAHNKMLAKKEKALQVGDRSINDSIFKAESDLRNAKREYVTLLNQNRFSHSIA